MSQTYTWPADVVTVALPPGGATAANQVLEIAQLTDINANTSERGQQNMANSFPVVIASDQSAVTVTGAVSTDGLTDAELRASPVPVSLTSTTITGSVAVTGPLTDAQLRAVPVPVSGTVATGGLTDAELRASPVPISGTVTATTGGLTDAELRASPVPVSLTSTTITGTVAATQSGTWTVQPGNTANTTAWLVNGVRSASSAVTSVASSATSVSLLASNAARTNATFYNDSTQIAYLKLGTTASNSSYTVQMVAGAYYELPVDRIYTGAIDAIWASANGNMRITELS